VNGSHMPRQAEPELMDVAAEAEAYAQADFAEVNQAFVERLLELAAHLDVAKAIDLGTGPADIPVRLVRARPNWKITAVDGSFAMLEWAEKNVRQAGLGEAIQLVLADAKHTKLPSHAFDVVFSNSILHHINEVMPFWAEVKRLAKPGAVVFLRDLARPPSTEAADRIVHDYAGEEPPLLQEEFYRSLLSAYTVEEIRSQLESAGLSNLQVAMVSDRHLDIFGQVSPV